MRSFNSLLTGLSVLTICFHAQIVGAQDRSPAVVRPTSVSADQLRLRHLLGDTTSIDWYLLRSNSLDFRNDSVSRRIQWLLPETYLMMNSAVPLSLNDGALWSGVGPNVRMTGGMDVRYGKWRVVIAPELLVSANARFETNTDGHYVSPPVPPGRSAVGYLDPWYVQPYSADVPRRFGGRSFVQVRGGQSGVWYRAGLAEIGATTENMWWGPGLQNAIVMSDNAGGIPRLEIRSAKPWRTRVGVFSGRWLVGALQESQYFDNDPDNDVRSISAAALTWRPAFQPTLTLGMTRAVYATAKGYEDVPLRWFDVFMNTGRPADRAPTDSALYPGGRDQVFSLFGRWVFPNDGVEAYAEWARQELPASFKEFFAAPTHGHGYTIGLQWRRPAPADARTVRVQAEMTTVEQSASFRDRPIGVFYTSRRVIQGYTQEGQSIGAAIGPGSSSQWLAIDRLGPTWYVGGTLRRVRWNEDVRSTYTWPPGGYGFCNHDVSFIPGVRGGRSTSRGLLDIQLLIGGRRNAFFQNVGGCKAGTGDKVDKFHGALAISFTPLFRR